MGGPRLLFSVSPQYPISLHQDVEQEFIDAVRWLEKKGVSGITGALAFSLYGRCAAWRGVRNMKKLWKIEQKWWFILVHGSLFGSQK